MKQLLLNIMILLLVMGCEEAYDWNQEQVILPDLVVEGMITNELKQHYVKLTDPSPGINEIPVPASGAIVAITDGDTVMFLSESSTEPGIYLTTPDVRGVFGKTYQLYIDYDGKIYQAVTSMEPVSPLSELNYRKSAFNPDLYQLQHQDQGMPAMIEYIIDWSHLPGADSAKSTVKIVDYTLNIIESRQLFAPEKETVVFPAYSRVVRNKYSLSDDHQKFVRTLLSETDWRGWIFDAMPGNVFTNISNGAVGFFAASSAISDTTTVLSLP